MQNGNGATVINPTVISGLQELYALRQHMAPLKAREEELIESITAGVAFNGMSAKQVQGLLAARAMIPAGE